jgi:hypothetical protein
MMFLMTDIFYVYIVFDGCAVLCNCDVLDVRYSDVLEVSDITDL